MGDFNSKLADVANKCTKGEVIRAINDENNDLKQLYEENDHFELDGHSTNRYGNARFYNFKEGKPWLFNPTYRTIHNKDKYLTSRVPAWTDRIIYRSTLFKPVEKEKEELEVL